MKSASIAGSSCPASSASSAIAATQTALSIRFWSSHSPTCGTRTNASSSRIRPSRRVASPMVVRTRSRVPAVLVRASVRQDRCCWSADADLWPNEDGPFRCSGPRAVAPRGCVRPRKAAIGRRRQRRSRSWAGQRVGRCHPVAGALADRREPWGPYTDGSTCDR